MEFSEIWPRNNSCLTYYIIIIIIQKRENNPGRKEIFGMFDLVLFEEVQNKK